MVGDVDAVSVVRRSPQPRPTGVNGDLLVTGWSTARDAGTVVETVVVAVVVPEREVVGVDRVVVAAPVEPAWWGESRRSPTTSIAVIAKPRPTRRGHWARRGGVESSKVTRDPGT